MEPRQGRRKDVNRFKEEAVRQPLASREKGFTLIEALIAIMILAFGLLAVVTMLDVSFSAGSLSKNMTTATELAAYMLDRVRQDTMSTADPVTADDARLQTFTNTAGSIILDTNNAAPASEPGRSAFLEWQRLFQLSDYSLPNGRGVVTITRNDVKNANNHTVTVQVTWRGILQRGVVLETTLPRGM